MTPYRTVQVQQPITNLEIIHPWMANSLFESLPWLYTMTSQFYIVQSRQFIRQFIATIYSRILFKYLNDNCNYKTCPVPLLLKLEVNQPFSAYQVLSSICNVDLGSLNQRWFRGIWHFHHQGSYFLSTVTLHFLPSYLNIFLYDKRAIFKSPAVDFTKLFRLRINLRTQDELSYVSIDVRTH